MIRDLYIIKNGIPVISKTWRPKQHEAAGTPGLPPHVDDTMVTGFLSAMADFVSEMGQGDMCEIQTSMAERFSFYRSPRAQDLLFVARADRQLNQKVCQTFLRRISGRFLKQYGEETMRTWKGKTEVFRDFQSQLENLADFIPERYVAPPPEPNTTGSTESENPIPRPEKPKKPGTSMDNIIPVFSAALADSPKEEIVAAVCHGLESKRVLEAVNGQWSVAKIGNKLGMEPRKVFQFCKSLVKMGVLVLVG